MGNSDRFWEHKTLLEMSQEEWEQLCDGCGRCCLVKLEDEDTGDFHITDVACSLFDGSTCRCKDYGNRHARISDCVKLDAVNAASLGWLPASCAYRRLAEGRGLAWWHPLVSGDPRTVVEAGISVMGEVVSEAEVDEDTLPDRIRLWPDW